MTDLGLALCFNACGLALFSWWVFNRCRKKRLETVAVTKFAFLKTNTVVPVLYKREVPDKKLHDALDVISKPAVAYYVCYHCGQDIVPPTRWLPVTGEFPKKLCSKCYDY
jgi:hypothetical protein